MRILLLSLLLVPSIALAQFRNEYPPGYLELQQAQNQKQYNELAKALTDKAKQETFYADPIGQMYLRQQQQRGNYVAPVPGIQQQSSSPLTDALILQLLQDTATRK